jgi:hypothetical protein
VKLVKTEALVAAPRVRLRAQELQIKDLMVKATLMAAVVAALEKQVELMAEAKVVMEFLLPFLVHLRRMQAVAVVVQVLLQQWVEQVAVAMVLVILELHKTELPI